MAACGATGAPAPPQRPQLAVSAAIFRNRQVLLVRRARTPALGRWTLPGGRVEHGETLTQALQREVREETGLAIDVIGLAGWREVLPGPGHGNGHFVILPFAARFKGGSLVLNDELDDARWLDPDQLGDLPTTEGLSDIVAAARALAGD